MTETAQYTQSSLSFKQWTENHCLKTFRKLINFHIGDLYDELYNQNQFSIQNQRIAVKNLQNICKSTFTLANEVGFQAMTLRQLSEQTGMSMGGLYAYIKSKDELALIIHTFLHHYCEDKMVRYIADDLSADKKLKALIHTHLYLSELMQPWFYFAFMEAKSLSKDGKSFAKSSELSMERKLFEVIEEGRKKEVFNSSYLSSSNSHLTAAMIKAMLQDWYLKRWKYKQRKISVDSYAIQVVDFTLSYLKKIN